MGFFILILFIVLLMIVSILKIPQILSREYIKRISQEMVKEAILEAFEVEEKESRDYVWRLTRKYFPKSESTKLKNLMIENINQLPEYKVSSKLNIIIEERVKTIIQDILEVGEEVKDSLSEKSSLKRLIKEINDLQLKRSPDCNHDSH